MPRPELIPWHALNVDRRALSSFDEWTGVLHTYVAQYRSNTGLYRVTRELRAPDEARAREAALAAIPTRRPQDIFWLRLHSLALKE